MKWTKTSLHAFSWCIQCLVDHIHVYEICRIKRLLGYCWDMNTSPFSLPCHCTLIVALLFDWLDSTFCLFVGSGGVRAENQEPSDKGEETTGQG